MADEEDIVEEEGKKSGGMLKIIILVVVVLLLIAGAVAGTWFYMKSTQPPPAPVEGEEGAAAAANDGGSLFGGDDMDPAIYHKLRPKFITTFEANNKQRYMQLEVTLMTRDEEAVAALTTHGPLIRNQLVLLFAKQDYVALQTPDGKSELKKEALTTVQSLLNNEIGNPGVEAILFTEFVMQ